MHKLLKFLELASLDRKLYWRIKSKDGNDEFEIEWRKESPTPWRLRKNGDVFWKLTTHEKFAEALEQESIDTVQFYHMLKQSILVQVAFADKIVKDAMKLLGPDEVQNAISENQRFMKMLEDAIMKIKGSSHKVAVPKHTPPPKPRLKLIKN